MKLVVFKTIFQDGDYIDEHLGDFTVTKKTVFEEIKFWLLTEFALTDLHHTVNVDSSAWTFWKGKESFYFILERTVK